MSRTEYTPDDDAALSAGLDRAYRRGRPSPRDTEPDEGDPPAEYVASVPEPDDL